MVTTARFRQTAELFVSGGALIDTLTGKELLKLGTSSSRLPIMRLRRAAG